MSERPSATKILELMEVGGAYPNVFVVGSLDRRVTFYAQQVRAINLAVALHRENRLPQGTRVAVIGAGIAGVTASVALAAKGASVTLFESADRLMSHQRVTNHRWVHPHIYDWPEDGWDENDAGLPVMNWQAGYPANFIPDQIDPQWERATELYADRLTLHTGVRRDSLRIKRQGSIYRLNWKVGTQTRDQPGDFEALVLCVGFGVEQPETDDTKPYWFQDALKNPPIRGTAEYLVSGTGDGGLTDALRVKLQDFEHSSIRDWAKSPCALRLGRSILDAERRRDTAEVVRIYEEDGQQFTRDSLVGLAVREDINLTLNGGDELPYSPGASRLNKLLVAALIGDGAITYQQGRLVGKVEDRGHNHEGHRYGVTLSFGDQGERKRDFDHVVLRHGPTGAHPLKELHEGIWKALASYREKRDDWSLYFNETRIPIWTDDDFPRALDHRVPEGWKLIDRPFLEAEARAFRPHMLTDFFDGSDPEWSVIASQRLFERGLTQTIQHGLSSSRDEERKWSLHLLLGPGGEGKSTIIRQFAAQAAREHGDWTILFRQAGGALEWRELQVMAAPHKPLILVSDQAHEFLDRGALARFMRNLEERSAEPLRAAEVHLILCANEFNWKPDRRVSRHIKNNAASSYHLKELSDEDASGIVSSQAQEDELGKLASLDTNQARTQKLLKLARGHGSTSLLGALLAARTGETLEVHVERILARLGEDTSALAVYATMALLQKYGLRYLDGRLIRSIVGGEWQDVSRIRQTLSAETTSSGLNETLKLRVRHDEIARVAMTLLREQNSEEWLAERCEELGRALPYERPKFYHDPVYRLVDILSDENEWVLAQAFAKGVCNAVPNDPHTLTKYAQVLREGNSPEEAERVIRAAHHRGRGMDRKVFFEWAVVWGNLVGEREDAAYWSAWLSLAALSDQASTEPVGDLSFLSIVAKGLTLVRDTHSSIERALTATIQLARAVPHPSATLRALLETQYSDVSVVSDAATNWPTAATGSLESVTPYLWSQTKSSHRPDNLPEDGQLTFSGLAQRVQA